MALGTEPFMRFRTGPHPLSRVPSPTNILGSRRPQDFSKKKKTKSMHVLRLKLRGSMLCALFISKDKSSSLKFCELSLELVLLELLGGQKGSLGSRCELIASWLGGRAFDSLQLRPGCYEYIHSCVQRCDNRSSVLQARHRERVLIDLMPSQTSAQKTSYSSNNFFTTSGIGFQIKKRKFFFLKIFFS